MEILVMFLLTLILFFINIKSEKNKQKREVEYKIRKQERIQKREDILKGDYEKYILKEEDKSIIDIIKNAFSKIFSK